MNQRRPNSRELNPEDLFRPEPAPQHQQAEEGYGYPGLHGAGQGAAVPPAQGGAWEAAPQDAPPQQAAATQYLPPYPAGAPAGEPQQAAATQYLPPYPAGAPAGEAQQAGATQYLPPYPAGAPAGEAQQAGATQYLPPYPAGDPAHGVQGAPVAGPQYPPPVQPQGFPPAAGAPYQVPVQPQPPYGGQQGGYLQQHMHAEPPREPRRGGSRRPSAKAIAGMVVCACALVGILSGALLSSGGDHPDASGPGAAVDATTGVTPPAAGGGSGAPSAQHGADAARKAQAQVLSGLLGTASSSRGSVVAAVASIGHCENVQDAHQDLVKASGQRRQLVNSLAGLKVDKLPSGAQLSAELRKAWQASAGADDEYAAWAADSVRSCQKHHKPAGGGHLAQAGQASATATASKKKASSLWNAIAKQTGLPTRSYSQL